MGLISYKKMAGQDVKSKITRLLESVKLSIKQRKPSPRKQEEILESDKDESRNWWSKYYASLEVISLWKFFLFFTATYYFSP